MVIEESIIIHSDMETVWKTFTDLSCWMNWNTVMKDLRSEEGDLRSGSSFKCSFSPFLFPVGLRISVEAVTPCNLIVWSAKKRGLLAVHEFFFETREKDVMVTSRETFTGFLTRGSGFLLPAKRMRTLTKIFLEDLKNASEN